MTRIEVARLDFPILRTQGDFERGQLHGTLVETQDAQHPYSAGLLRSMPRLDERDHGRLQTIAGQPPNLQRLPPGCAFQERCEHRFEPCLSDRPALRPVGGEHAKACHLERL